MAERKDPYAQYNFLIEIDGLSVAGFTEVGGLTTESDIIEYREGADPATVRKLPGLRKVTNITLKRGFTQNRELWDWRKTTLDGQTLRKSGSVILLNEAREEVLRWNFMEGWISKWEGPALNATANEAAVESLEIVHEGLELA
ncbi:MAG: phage tail protein [Gammaproteobacteria bacterium]|mgnify:CR=1 FL=1|nr:phage tail protein [Gammaproteobacteria bacterium]